MRFRICAPKQLTRPPPPRHGIMEFSIHEMTDLSPFTGTTLGSEDEEEDDDEDDEKSDEEEQSPGSGGARETVTKWVVCSGRNPL